MKFDERADTLMRLTLEVFGQDGADEWLCKPNPKYDNQPPIFSLRSDEDMEKVLDILAGIKHGFPA